MGRRANPSWDEPGWREAAETWIRSALTRLARPVTGEIEDVRIWALSCVLRAPTDDGWVYFKEALDLPLFADEPRVTQHLAELYPKTTPMVLATDPGRRWMLTGDAGEIVGWDAPQAEWTTLYAQCARTQVSAVQHVDGLLAVGCLDRDIRRMPSQFDAVLDDTETMALLPQSTADALARLRPRLSDACEDLAAVGIPNTLVHGDLHVGNMAVQHGRCVVIDGPTCVYLIRIWMPLSLTAWKTRRPGNARGWLSLRRGEVSRLRAGCARRGNCQKSCVPRITSCRTGRSWRTCRRDGATSWSATSRTWRTNWEPRATRNANRCRLRRWTSPCG
ncbi:MAG: phosphotransferase [Candidatus Poribacteria bacterium]